MAATVTKVGQWAFTTGTVVEVLTWLADPTAGRKKISGMVHVPGASLTVLCWVEG